jgi:glycosyltransferase involved in cell wall biosynthesis
MLIVVIPTHESARPLVRTLACLVPGATGGLVTEVILADAGSSDDTAAIGDIAGCNFMPLPGPLGARLIVHRQLYQQLGGHRAAAEDAERDFLRRIGRARVTILRSGAAIT